MNLSNELINDSIKLFKKTDKKKYQENFCKVERIKTNYGLDEVLVTLAYIRLCNFYLCDDAK